MIRLRLPRGDKVCLLDHFDPSQFHGQSVSFPAAAVVLQKIPAALGADLVESELASDTPRQAKLPAVNVHWTAEGC